MANEIVLRQRAGNSRPVLRRITPVAGGGLGFDSSGKLTGRAGSSTKVYAVDGPLSIQSGIHLLTKATAGAYTLAAPTAAQDGTEMLIVSTTAVAHTVTQAAPGINANGAAADVATYGAAKGNTLRLVAYNGAWYAASLTGVTLA